MTFPDAGMIAHLSDSIIPRNLLGPVLLDRRGIPRYWAAIWSIAAAGQLANSTHLKKLRYIGNLYLHADELCGDGALDDALGTLNDRALAEILESWFFSIRNQPRTSEADETRWQTGLGFATTVVTWVAKTDSDKHLRKIESRLQQLSILYSQFRINKRNQPETIRSLPALVVETLYQMLDPSSTRHWVLRMCTGVSQKLRMIALSHTRS